MGCSQVFGVRAGEIPVQPGNLGTAVRRYQRQAQCAAAAGDPIGTLMLQGILPGFAAIMLDGLLRLVVTCMVIHVHITGLQRQGLQNRKHDEQ